ncbi:MAG: TerB family tellurite resistance protein [Pararhodobacter sp.]|nr:TerB family tellurite resistance protein [Pararhodobacter sp.]
MIDALRNLFRTEPAPRNDAPQDVAVAALLIEAARADGVYDDAERRAVLRLLQEMFGLSAAEALALHERGDGAQQDAADVVRFTRVIKRALDEAERIALIEALWQVVLVDHDRDPHENALLRNLAPLIAVSDRDSAEARHRVQARIGPGAV